MDYVGEISSKRVHRPNQQLDRNRRCFGHYKCPKCNRTWMSGNSWVGYGQQCTSCKINVQAFKQTPLEKSNNKSDPNKSHPQELCQKCRAIGHFCGSSIYRY